MPIFDPVIITKPMMVKIHATARIDSFVKIEGGQGVVIGKDVHIASFVHINVGGGQVIFEEGSAAASGAKIAGGSNLLSGESCSAVAPAEKQVIERKLTTICKNAVVFMNAVVLPGVTIGEGAVVAAGAVVRNNVPDFEIWGGVPARKIGDRAAYVDALINDRLPPGWEIKRRITRNGFVIMDANGRSVEEMPAAATGDQLVERAWFLNKTRYGGMSA